MCAHALPSGRASRKKVVNVAQKGGVVAVLRLL
jgi:hypothetical protein